MIVFLLECLRYARTLLGEETMASEPFFGFMRKSPLKWQQFVGYGLLPDQTIATIITIGEPKQMTMGKVLRYMVDISLDGKWTMQCGVGSCCRFIMTRLSQLKANSQTLHDNKFEMAPRLRPGVYNINEAKRQLNLTRSRPVALFLPVGDNPDDDDWVVEIRDVAEEQLQRTIARASQVEDTLAADERILLWDENGPRCSPCILHAAEKYRSHRHSNDTLYLKVSYNLVEVGVREAGQFCRIGVISHDVERTPNGHFRLHGEPWDG